MASSVGSPPSTGTFTVYSYLCDADPTSGVNTCAPVESSVIQVYEPQIRAHLGAALRPISSAAISPVSLYSYLGRRPHQRCEHLRAAPRPVTIAAMIPVAGHTLVGATSPCFLVPSVPPARASRLAARKRETRGLCESGGAASVCPIISAVHHEPLHPATLHARSTRHFLLESPPSSRVGGTPTSCVLGKDAGCRGMFYPFHIKLIRIHPRRTRNAASPSPRYPGTCWSEALSPIPNRTGRSIAEMPLNRSL